jgi:hypothetical protein
MSFASSTSLAFASDGPQARRDRNEAAKFCTAVRCVEVSSWRRIQLPPSWIIESRADFSQGTKNTVELGLLPAGCVLLVRFWLIVPPFLIQKSCRVQPVAIGGLGEDVPSEAIHDRFEGFALSGFVESDKGGLPLNVMRIRRPKLVIELARKRI